MADAERAAAPSSRTAYARKLLQEIGTTAKLAGAGAMALGTNEAFNSAEAADRLPIWGVLLIGALGITLAAAGVLMVAEAER